MIGAMNQRYLHNNSGLLTKNFVNFFFHHPIVVKSLIGQYLEYIHSLNTSQELEAFLFHESVSYYAIVLLENNSLSELLTFKHTLIPVPMSSS